MKMSSFPQQTSVSTDQMTPAEHFEEIYRTTHVDVLAYLYRRAPDREDAADMLSQVYMIAWRKWAQAPLGAERLWLFGIARIELKEHHRRFAQANAGVQSLRDLIRAHTPGAADETSPDHSQNETEVAAPRNVALHAALATLSDEDRELVTLTIWEGLSIAEAATSLGIKSGTARVRLFRARSKLARELKLEEPAEPPAREFQVTK